MKIVALMLTVLFYFSCSQITKKTSSPSSLENAVSSNFRSSENKKRDQYRHPLETLQFFGIKPDMTVIEISPGAGWYTEILAPYLAEEGQYIMAMPPSSNAPYAIANAVKIKSIMDRNTQVAGKIKTVEFNPSKELSMVEPGTADMVLTFRNVHNWMENNADLAAFQSFYEALKPGGILGVVEHRAGTNTAPSGKSGYVPEAYVIDLAQKAGFKLVAKSEINANPKDTKDYPEGVWTLPPTLRLGEKDKKKYLEIGESDRMTLKFIKE